MTNIPGLNGDAVRALERQTIERFLRDFSVLLRGDVLDFGCGTQDTCREPMPYRDLIELAGGRYFGYDPALGHNRAQWLRGPYHAIVCTQVIQMIRRPWECLRDLRWAIKPGGHLLMTYPTTWPQTGEEHDYWRFTAKGMTVMLEATGWKVVASVERGLIDIPDWPLLLGHGVVARAEEEV